MLIHKMTIAEECDAPLIEAEAYLVDTCKEYNIDYTTCELNDIPVTEGIIGNIVQFIKNIFRKAIQFLVKLWKSIIGFVKTVISKIVSFFKRIFGIKDRPKKIDISVPIIISPGVYKVMHFSSYEEMRTAYTKAMNAFSKEINRSERESIDGTNKLQTQCMETVTESMTTVDEGALVYKSKVPKYMYGTLKGAHLSDYNFGKSKTRGWGNIGGDDTEEVEFSDDQKAIAIQSEIDRMHSEDRVNVTLPAKDEFSFINNNFIDVFDPRYAKELDNIRGKSKNKVTGVFSKIHDTKYSIETQAILISELYNQFKEDCVLSILERSEKFKSVSDNSFIGKYMKDLNLFAEICKKYLSEDEMRIKLADDIFPNFDHIKDPQEKVTAISNYIKLRQNWNLNIVQAIRTMIVTNAQALRLGEKTVRWANFDKKTGRPYSEIDIDEFRKIFSANLHKMISDDDAMIDGRKFGLGVICISDVQIDEFFDSNVVTNPYDVGAINVLRNPLMYDTLMVNLTKYDLTVISHGTVDQNGRWVMEQVRTPSGIRLSPRELIGYSGNFIDVNDYLRQCVKEGFKRIHMQVCNPGHTKLDNDLLMNRKVLVIMGSEVVLRGW